MGGGDGVSLSALSTLPTTLDNARNREIGRQTTSLAEALDLTPQTSQAMKDAQNKMIQGIDDAGGALRAFNDHLYSTVKQHGTDAINNLAVDRMVAKIDGDNNIQWGDNAKSKAQISAALKSGNHTQILNGLENLRQVIGNTTVSQADIQALSASSAASASGDSSAASNADGSQDTLRFDENLQVNFDANDFKNNMGHAFASADVFKDASNIDNNYNTLLLKLQDAGFNDEEFKRLKDANKNGENIAARLFADFGNLMGQLGVEQDRLGNVLQTKLDSL